jgi:hypothetical protein
MVIMISTFELDKVISDIMPNRDVAEMHMTAIVGGVLKEYFVYISSLQKEDMEKDFIHAKEHFGKMFYFYLVDRDTI